MPEKKTVEKARAAKREGKSPSTQAGEFVREEVHHVREGKHGARSAKQAIAIGLSKARRAGVDIPDKSGAAKKAVSRKAGSKKAAPKKATAAKKTRIGSAAKPNPRRSRAAKEALKREPSSAGSHRALSKQAHAAAKKRTPAERSASAHKAARTRAAEG